MVEFYASLLFFCVDSNIYTQKIVTIRFFVKWVLKCNFKKNTLTLITNKDEHINFMVVINITKSNYLLSVLKYDQEEISHFK